MNERRCSVEGCERPVRARGICGGHYERLRTRGTLDPYVRPPIEHGTTTGYSRHGCRCDLCREAERVNKAAYRNRHRERTSAAAKDYESRNRERISARRARERVADPEKFRLRTAAWAASNRDKRHLAKLRRRAREANADVRSVSEKDWTRLLRRYRYACAYCGEVRPLTREHIIPLARGGRNSIGNLLPVCGSCNYSKGAKLLVEWKRRRFTA